MQIDLFSDSMMTRTNNRSVKQIEKRSFSLDVTLATIETKFKELLPEEEFALFRRSVYESINVKREYTGIGTNFCDNKLYLEYLGIGKYAKDYTVIVDLSNCLDYILHRLTGCDPNKIRNIENYDLGDIK